MPPVVALLYAQVHARARTHTHRHARAGAHARTCTYLNKRFFSYFKSMWWGKGSWKNNKKETPGVNEQESMRSPNYQLGVFFLLLLNYSSTLIHTSLSGQHCSPKAAVCNFLYSYEARKYKKHMIVSQT